MKDNPKLGVKRKTQKSVKHKIEGDQDIEDHVTQWQEFTTIKQGQEQEDPDSKVSVKIHLDTGNKFIVSFVDEHTGYMWIYRMKTKDEMPKVIRKWMIRRLWGARSQFSSWSWRDRRMTVSAKGALVNSFWAGRSVMEGLRRWSLRH
jgi:hypothetical protein